MQLKGHGGFEQLEIRDDVPIPEPAPGEVLIRLLKRHTGKIVLIPSAQ